ncbi:MAG: pyruvate, phosphate dikinase [Bacteroidales bacterium]|nr:pyruvate, phosphate dikinase [Bacteroidales bacterium]
MKKKGPEEKKKSENNAISPELYQYLLAERLKELSCINQTSQILREGKSIEESLQQISEIIPKAWQYPEFTVARITFRGMEFTSPNFKETPWFLSYPFATIDNQEGRLEVYYLKEFPSSDEGPFLKEERDLINNLAGIITGYLNSVKGKTLIKKTITDKSVLEKFSPIAGKSKYSRQLLQSFLNKSNQNRDIYHDLMPFKVKEILLVASLYDAYTIEKEGKFSEHVLEDYQQLNLTSIPRITGVSTPEEAMEELRKKHFDLVIIMVGVDKKAPLGLSCKVKNEFPYIPIFLLLNNNSDIAFYNKQGKKTKHIAKIFIWNGESKMFFAMIKHVEDKINAENDTKIGLVRIILLVEDSAIYYSRYLPLLYSVVMDQTKRIMDDVSTDDLYKVLKLRARPKILLATTFEEALSIINHFKEYMLCLITDMKFEKEGRLDENAGVSLITNIRKKFPRLPIILQSSETTNERIAHEQKVTFIDKNSETLSQDFKSFITHYLGFGNFVYKNSKGKQIAIARSLDEFEKHLRTIPDDSILYHARRDHFSLWLMARGEIQAAKVLHPRRTSDFKNAPNIREYLISVINKFRDEKDRGMVIPFKATSLLDEKNIVSLMPGSLGGKGRGVTFINNLIYNFDFSAHVPNINIKAPITAVIGTEEFEYFLQRNKLYDTILNHQNYEEIKRLFIKGNLTQTLISKLKVVLKNITKPIAVRSSGLFEDSMMQPFAGIFETFLLPNNHPDFNVRLEHLTNAIKMVFVSVYSPISRSYIEAVHYKIEEEKMAVVIQEVVGNQFGNTYYPHISGAAQSYNFYPFSHMKPEEGFAVIALGLGKYVVEGEKAFRFSPKYPNAVIDSPKDQFRNSQVNFFAVDMNKKNIDLLEGDTAGLIRLDIDDAEMHGTMIHSASVYDIDNNRITPGLSVPGPRILNFADILKYNYVPLAKTIEIVLDVVKEALGSPVEIEFAVDLKKDSNYKASFYLLQIKPLIGSAQDYKINMSEIDKNQILLYTEKGMGNGLISNICDIVYIDREKFDKSKTIEMAEEIEKINQDFFKKKKQYILIGPGRWGTRDRWIGIPVKWPQISQAKIIVETSLEGYPLDASSGSHFFHNLTSMNVGYFSIQNETPGAYINWEILEKQKDVKVNGFFKHIRFDSPLSIKMDGKKRIAVIALG